MNDPTPALDALVEQGVRPRVEYLSGLVAEIIGCDPSDQRVLRCVASIQSQTIAYLPNPIAERLGLALAPTPANLEASPTTSPTSRSLASTRSSNAFHLLDWRHGATGRITGHRPHAGRGGSVLHDDARRHGRRGR